LCHGATAWSTRGTLKDDRDRGLGAVASAGDGVERGFLSWSIRLAFDDEVVSKSSERIRRRPREHVPLK